MARPYTTKWLGLNHKRVTRKEEERKRGAENEDEDKDEEEEHGRFEYTRDVHGENAGGEISLTHTCSEVSTACCRDPSVGEQD